VTVLYPFVSPERVDQSVISDLAAAVGSVSAFDVTFARVRPGSWRVVADMRLGVPHSR